MADTTEISAPLGVAPLCAISSSIEEYLGGAAAAGFEFAGIRLSPVSASDTVYSPGGGEFRRLQRALRDTELSVLDIEVFSITPATTREAWLPLLEMAGELGASLFNVVGDEPDLVMFAEKVGQLTEDARAYSITPVIEPIAYRPMNSYEVAVQIAKQVGCAVELDALHVVRTGMDVTLVAQNPELFPVLQLCDAPAAVPQRAYPHPEDADPRVADMIAESRLNRLLPGDGVAPLDAMRDAVAPGTPVAVEIPHAALQARFTVDSYMKLLYTRAHAFLAGTNHMEGQQ